MWKSFHSVETCRFSRMTVTLNFHTSETPVTHGGACVEIQFRLGCLWVFCPISAAAGTIFHSSFRPVGAPS